MAGGRFNRIASDVPTRSGVGAVCGMSAPSASGET